MRKLNLKKVVIVVLLAFFTLIELFALGLSKAKKISSINLCISDFDSFLEQFVVITDTYDGGESGYYIELPEFINTKRVSKYLIQEKQIIETQATIENIEEDENSANQTENTQANVVNEANANETKNAQIEKIENVEKQPGDRVFLTEQEINDSQIEVQALYDKKELDGSVKYNRLLEQKIKKDEEQANSDDNLKNISIQGYLPENITLKLDEVEKEHQNLFEEKKIDGFEISETFNIKLVDGESTYDSDQEEYTIRLSIIDTNKEYKIFEISVSEDGKKTLKLTEKELKNENDTLYFKTSKIQPFVVFESITKEKNENTEIKSEGEKASSTSTEEILAKAIRRSRSIVVSSEDVWDGTTAGSFSFGNGTSSSPYLISTGKELAYLASQVNSGNSYEGVYFQLVNNINLNENEWTPIGNISNSFRGIFNGAGHTISNAEITISALPTTLETYGIFGSIGGGNSDSVVKNTEFDAVNITITASGTTGSSTTTKGFHIGTVVGTMYKNSSIMNVIARNSLITNTQRITLYNYYSRVAIGGVCGIALNTSSSETDPGSGSRYQIENCYSNTEIDIMLRDRQDDRSYFGQYATGGIIGIIRSQPVWPSNCIYEGTIRSRGFTGPIFGQLRNNTSYTSTNNYATLWNGNDAGSLTMNSYYSSYAAGENGTTFTTTVTSGTSTARVSNSTNSMGYVQGVNKGIYTNNIQGLLTTLNNNAGTNEVKWKYENGSLGLVPRLSIEIQEIAGNRYQAIVHDQYTDQRYSYSWFVDGSLDTSATGNISSVLQGSFDTERDVQVLASDGTYYALASFKIERLYLNLEFNINNNENSVTAYFDGTAANLVNMEDYTLQWYLIDPFTLEEIEIPNSNSLTLNNLEKGKDYKLVATNNAISQMTVENSFSYGNRTVIYVNYSNGNNNRDGLTPETAVRTLANAYGKISNTGSMDTNIIVLTANYTTRDIFYNTKDSTNATYTRNATITGQYAGISYNPYLYLYYTSNYNSQYYNFINGDTTFQYLTFYGNNSQAYLYAQGHNLVMGKGLRMYNYSSANTNQGLITGSAPAFHVLGGYLQYNRSTLPRNNGTITIKSGSYGRVLGGGGSGTASGVGQTTSHDFTGSNLTNDTYTCTINVDIEDANNSTYAYDINLLTGGSTAGNMYANVTINVKSGKIGRLLGGSIGDTTSMGSSWRYPENTYIGYSTINLTGGTIQELYGGSLGRNMDALSGDSSVTCDIYYYGTITINISGNTVVNNNIYGAGAGGVTGYSQNSSDPYKSYGQNINSTVNINISGGTINGNVYGGGYGYTEYLTAATTAADGGSLYGNSNITITGGTIAGNVYGAGCGADISQRPNLAQMEGNSAITISGSPTITGDIYGAGAGVSGYTEMAKHTGTSSVTINSDLTVSAYGGGNIAKLVGNSTLNINSGTHTANIYGGGNVGIIDGASRVYINGGTQTGVFGGGNQAETTTTNVYIVGGNTNEVYGGGNQAGVTTSNVYLQGGQAGTIYGGSNQSGNVATSNVIATTGTCSTAIYGGNNQGGTVTTSNVTINGVTLDTVYGGGNKATTGETNVIILNGTVSNAFGGGNEGAATETNLTIEGGTVSFSYGGGNKASATTTNVELKGGTSTNIFGGSNQSGNVTNSNVILTTGNATNVYGGNNQGGTTANSLITINGGTIINVYGGNNQGGTTTTSNIVSNNGTVTNIYGGGNRATAGTTNVSIVGGTIQTVFGGGNAAGVSNNTNLVITGGTINGNVYGGGNDGTVSGNTNVKIQNGNVKGSAYAGGNGATATVSGNSNITIAGNTVIGVTSNTISPHVGSVFGGGNAAATGNENNSNSINTVNIVGGTINGNVYGGANTSVAYGYTVVNIGYDAVNDNTLTKGNIDIKGTVFGGGEANASGSETYDFSFISVTEGIDINIDANGHNVFNINGSIFGSGNASSAMGESTILIKNYGSRTAIKKNVSIQRATTVTLDNSNFYLIGTTDRTNEYSTVKFTLSRIEELKMKNNSTLFLECGTNLLQKFSSLVDDNGVEIKGAATINEDTGAMTRNVDNRLYIYEGKNVNIALNENVTLCGDVDGMTFLGLYNNINNPIASVGLYDFGYSNGDEITNAGTFVSNSYVKGAHKASHDIHIDGFYTNYNEDRHVKVGYVGVTPDDDTYYIWSVGEMMDVTTFPITLTASKYATLGTKELSLDGFSAPNTKFFIVGFSETLNNGIVLTDINNIQAISPNETTANTVFGLSMGSGKFGWNTNNKNYFYTDDGTTYTGSNYYLSDNSNMTPSLVFCLFHSQNLTLQQDLGSVTIRFQVLRPIDDLNDEISYIDIVIDMSTLLNQDCYYEAAITPGEETSLFTTMETNITQDGEFTTYYSLLINSFSDSDYYDDFLTYKRVLVSRNNDDTPHVLPAHTKITLLDMATNKYYYYNVTPQDATDQKYIYPFSDFIEMGSTEKKYNIYDTYNFYVNEDQDLVYENFICRVDFGQCATRMENSLNNSLLIELQDANNQTLIGVLSMQRDTTKYSIYTGVEASIEVEATCQNSIYLGENINLTVNTDFTQTVQNNVTIYDTKYMNSKLGIQISFFDSDNNQLSSDSLFGINFEYNGITYYPKTDGTIRIKIADRVSNVLSRIKIKTANNTTLSTGDYTIKVETFGSPDGIYYGQETSDFDVANIHIINGIYGLKVTTDNNSKIVNKTTGMTLSNTNSITANVQYSSNLSNPNIVVSLRRRDYTREISTEYNDVDLADYISNQLGSGHRSNEYMAFDTPVANNTITLQMKQNLVTGTYKLTFKLYDGSSYIGSAYEYIIIK